MGLGAMTYMPSFIKIDSGIQKVMGRGMKTDRKVILYAYFYFFKIRKVG
jgi:hypothetical protein